MKAKGGKVGTENDPALSALQRNILREERTGESLVKDDKQWDKEEKAKDPPIKAQ